MWDCSICIKEKVCQKTKKSLALSLLMHDTQKTLTDSDADTAIANLLQLLQIKFDAVLRN